MHALECSVQGQGKVPRSRKEATKLLYGQSLLPRPLEEHFCGAFSMLSQWVLARLSSRLNSAFVGVCSGTLPMLGRCCTRVICATSPSPQWSTESHTQYLTSDSKQVDSGWVILKVLIGRPESAIWEFFR